MAKAFLNFNEIGKVRIAYYHLIYLALNPSWTIPKAFWASYSTPTSELTNHTTSASSPTAHTQKYPNRQ